MGPLMAIAHEETQAAYWTDQAAKAHQLGLFGAERAFAARADTHAYRARKLHGLANVTKATT